MAEEDRPHFIKRQFSSWFMRIFSENFPHEVINIDKTVVFTDFYVFRVKYRKNGRVKKGIFKMFDDGRILRCILPAVEWQFGPYEGQYE